MPTYTVTDPLTKKTLSLTGDSPPTENELNEIFSKVNEPKTKSINLDYIKQQVAQFKGSPLGLVPSAYDLVKEGAKKFGDKAAQVFAKQGINTAPPTVGAPSLPVSPGVAKGLGKVIEYAPDVVSLAAPNPYGREPQPGKFAKGLFKQMESASGGMEGSLQQQYKNPLTVLGKGTESATPAYQVAMKKLPYEKTVFKGLADNKEIFEKAKSLIDEGAQLAPQEAFIARKAIDAVKKKLSKDAFAYYRDILDKIAKGSEDIAKADPAHRAGMMAESLRQLMPQNKYGGASAFKMGIVPALSGLGGYIAGPSGAAAGATAGAAALSPIVQSGIVGGAGLAARTARSIPINAGATALLNALKNNKKKGQ